MKNLFKSTGKFLFLFVLMIISLAIILNYSLSFYVKMYNDGAITVDQSILFGTITLLAVSGVTVFVGWRLFLYLESVSILYNKIKKSGRDFWIGMPFAVLIFLVSNIVGAYYFTEYNLLKPFTSLQILGWAIMVSGTAITGYVIGSLHEEKLSSPHGKVHNKNIDKNS